MTPCEERGYKVGDLFRVVKHGIIVKESIVMLAFDNNSTWPKFEIIFGRALFNDLPYIYECIDNVEPLPKNKEYTYANDSM